MYLWLDDNRNPLYKAPNGGEWVIARDYNEAVSLVETFGFPLYVSFDHDLGIVDGVELNGYDFAKYLCERDMDFGGMPEQFTFFVHSGNPTGAKNIQMYLDNYLKHR